MNRQVMNLRQEAMLKASFYFRRHTGAPPPPCVYFRRQAHPMHITRTYNNSTEHKPVQRAEPGTGCPGTSRGIPKKVAIFWSRSRHPLGPKQARAGPSTSYQLQLPLAVRPCMPILLPGVGLRLAASFRGQWADPAPGAPLDRMRSSAMTR
jgi:hypothetical protein